MTFNSRRNVLDVISLQGEILYHLFRIDGLTLTTEDMVKLWRKSKWHSQIQTSYLGNLVLEHIKVISKLLLCRRNITAFDFDPAGKKAATISREGIFLISDIGTNKCSFEMQVVKGDDDLVVIIFTTRILFPITLILNSIH